MLRFGPTWEEASCAIDQNGLEAMRHVLVLWPNVGRGLARVLLSGLEAMLARLRSGSDAGMLQHV